MLWEVQEAIDQIPFVLQAGKVPALMGGPGIGKTERATAKIRSMGYAVESLQIGAGDRSDVASGIVTPQGNLRYEVVETLRNLTPNHVLLLDEIGECETFADLDSIVHGKNVRGIPVNVAGIVCCGNLQGQGSSRALPSQVVTRLSYMVIDRYDMNPILSFLSSKNVEHGGEEILAWAQFVAKQGNIVKCPAKYNVGKQFSTPRGLESAIACASAGQNPVYAVSSCMGETAEAEFVTWKELIQDMPSVSNILLNPETAPVTMSTVTACVLMSQLAFRVASVATQHVATQASKYLDRMGSEFRVQFIHQFEKFLQEKKLPRTHGLDMFGPWIQQQSA